MQGVRDGKVTLAPDLEEDLNAGDAWFVRFRQMMEDYVEYTGLELPEEGGQDDAGGVALGEDELLLRRDLAFHLLFHGCHISDFCCVVCMRRLSPGRPPNRQVT